MRTRSPLPTDDAANDGSGTPVRVSNRLQQLTVSAALLDARDVVCGEWGSPGDGHLGSPERSSASSFGDGVEIAVSDVVTGFVNEDIADFVVTKIVEAFYYKVIPCNRPS